MKAWSFISGGPETPLPPYSQQSHLVDCTWVWVSVGHLLKFLEQQRGCVCGGSYLRNVHSCSSCVKCYSLGVIWYFFTGGVMSDSCWVFFSFFLFIYLFLEDLRSVHASAKMSGCKAGKREIALMLHSDTSVHATGSTLLFAPHHSPSSPTSKLSLRKC